MDGAGPFRIFLSVVVPAVRPAMAVLGMLTFLTAWNDFFWPIIVLSSQNPTVQVAFQGLATGYAPQQSIIMAGTLYGTIPVLIVFASSAGRSSEASCRARSKDDGDERGSAARDAAAEHFPVGRGDFRYRSRAPPTLTARAAFDLGMPCVSGPVAIVDGSLRRPRGATTTPLRRGRDADGEPRHPGVPVLPLVVADPAGRLLAGRAPRDRLLRPTGRRAAVGGDRALGHAVSLGPARGPVRGGWLARARHRVSLCGVRPGRPWRTQRPSAFVDDAQ